MLDLAKAFDTVNHKILLHLLPDFGIDNLSLKWFHSYLEYRKQRVKIYSFISHEKTIEYGIPQGSVLGPILFILYLNLVSNLNLDGSVVTYADDTRLIFTDNSWI